MLSVFLLASLAVGQTSNDLLGPAPDNLLIARLPAPLLLGEEDPFAVDLRRPPTNRRTRLPDDLEALWPDSVERIPGLRSYVPMTFSQRLSLEGTNFTNRLWPIDKDDRPPVGPAVVNPNRIFPYAVSGGLHDSTGWVSIKAAKIPGVVDVWTEEVPVPLTSAKIPKQRWQFPDGTVFVDMLAKDGVCFELRTSTKTGGKWKQEAIYRDLEAAPEKFHGAGRSCVSCHKDAGASLNYGITVRGDDRVFSWSPYDESGSFRYRGDVQLRDVGIPSAFSSPSRTVPVAVNVSPLTFAVSSPLVSVSAPVRTFSSAPMMSFRRAVACST